jgi:hypothetical protein
MGELKQAALSPSSVMLNRMRTAVDFQGLAGSGFLGVGRKNPGLFVACAHVAAETRSLKNCGGRVLAARFSGLASRRTDRWRPRESFWIRTNQNRARSEQSIGARM